MKRIHYIIIVVLASIGFSSCEFKHNNIGDLAGMWQLTQWNTRSSSGQIDSLVANNLEGDNRVPNTRKIYFLFQREIFQIKDASTYFNTCFYCTFTHANSEIKLDLSRLINYEGKQEEDMYNQIKDFGIPADGRFHVDLLNDDNMQLSFDDNILTFRKY